MAYGMSVSLAVKTRRSISSRSPRAYLCSHVAIMFTHARNGSSIQPYLAANLVLCDLSICRDRHGVSGKEMQRTLDVTCKTAWRIGHQFAR